MNWLGRVWRRFRRLVQREAVERGMDSEMRYHIECEASENVRLGMTPDAARRTALLAFGGVERFKEDGRDGRGGRLLEDVAMDLRHALRVLSRNRTFTIASVLTFALGLGAATAIYSVVCGVLLRPLPYREPAQLVTLWEQKLGGAGNTNVVSSMTFDAWRERSRLFSGMAALIPAPVTVTGAGDAERITAMQASPGYFRLLGAVPMLGREFTEDEAANGGAPVVVLSHAYWRHRFGNDSGVIGRTLVLDGKANRIVGVMPATFDPPRFGWIDEQEIWLPFGSSDMTRSWGHVLHVVARLRPGVTVAQAAAEISGISAQRARDDPDAKGWSASVVGLADTITGDVRKPLLLLLGGVLVLLLLAVANVANLSLGLARRRAAELAVRRAIGATSGRLFRQLLTQSAVVGALGCVIGLGVAAVGLRVLLAMIPPSIPRVESVHLDHGVLLIALAVTLLATVIFGTVAAVRGTAAGARTLSTATGVRATPRAGGGSLITIEIALATILTILAALTVKSFANLRAVDLGFDATDVVVGRIALTGDRYASPASQRLFFDALLERLRAAPGVSAASLINTRPFRGGAPTTTIAGATDPVVPEAELPIADIRFADSALFGALGIRLHAGTIFPARARTTPGGVLPIVINEAAVHALGMPPSPIGKQVRIRLNGGLIGEIVGVVGDVHLSGPRNAPRSTVYFPPLDGEVYDVVVRGKGDAGSLTRAMRAAVAIVDSSLPLYQVAPLAATVDEDFGSDRFTVLLLTMFSLLALLLAGVGIYGVFSTDVSQRRRELGVRHALGAGTGRIVTMVVWRALARAGLGVAIGISGALLVTRFIAPLLFGVGATDLGAFAAVAVILLALALAAALVPAWRAARVSPVIAMRSE